MCETVRVLIPEQLATSRIACSDLLGLARDLFSPLKQIASEKDVRLTSTPLTPHAMVPILGDINPACHIPFGHIIGLGL